MTLIGTIDKLVLIWIPVLQAYWRPTKLETLGRRGRKHVYSTSCTDYYQDIVRCTCMFCKSWRWFRPATIPVIRTGNMVQYSTGSYTKMSVMELSTLRTGTCQRGRSPKHLYQVSQLAHATGSHALGLRSLSQSRTACGTDVDPPST
jgi:hypothetical protein